MMRKDLRSALYNRGSEPPNINTSACPTEHTEEPSFRRAKIAIDSKTLYFSFMGFEYKVKDQYGQYFVTFTVHQWVDVFTRREYVDIFLDSVKFCQEKKGLQVYAWVIMTNHVHLIISSKGEQLSDIIRDLKKFTSSRIVKAIEDNPKESRKRWLLWLLRKDDKVIFWKEGYHGEEIVTKEFFDSKLAYIHANPVKASIVKKEEEYLYSSCKDYYGNGKGLLELVEE